MRLLADENFDPKLIDWLRDEGHDVLAVRDCSPGMPDVDVVALAMRESRVVLTRDKDFGELAIRDAKPIPGVLLIRIHSATRSEYLDAFTRRWSLIFPHLQGNLVVVTNASLRVRVLQRHD